MQPSSQLMNLDNRITNMTIILKTARQAPICRDAGGADVERGPLWASPRVLHPHLSLHDLWGKTNARPRGTPTRVPTSPLILPRPYTGQARLW